MSEIIVGIPSDPHVVGQRYIADWDRLVDGKVVTFRNVPYFVLREVPESVYRECHPNAPAHRAGCRYYEVSLD